MSIKGPPIIKLSGKALNDKDNLTRLFLSLKGHEAIIVHGGGVEVDALLKKLDIATNKIDGIRVSPASDMPYICAALGGICNKALQGTAIACGLQAIGLMATDGNSLSLVKAEAKYGNVASAKAKNKIFLEGLLSCGITPVICSLGHDENGELYNINADDVASALAELFNSDLYFISDVAGVLDKDKKLIESIDEKICTRLIEDKVITDGMVVKVKAALDTAAKTHNNVIIASISDPLLSGIFTHRRFGTIIKN